jgi:hypothetical protein
MKAQINLRSTFSNTTTWQRGGAALAALSVLALIGVLVIANLRSDAESFPAARMSLPANNRSNGPVIDTGSAYDGGHYAGALPATRVSTNRPAIGTGSVYDGGHYGSAIAAGSATVKQSGFGTGSVYTGGN